MDPVEANREAMLKRLANRHEKRILKQNQSANTTTKNIDLRATEKAFLDSSPSTINMKTPINSQKTSTESTSSPILSFDEKADKQLVALATWTNTMIGLDSSEEIDLGASSAEACRRIQKMLSSKASEVPSDLQTSSKKRYQRLFEKNDAEKIRKQCRKLLLDSGMEQSIRDMLSKNMVAIRKEHAVYSDLALQTTLLRTFLSFHPAWLKAALEAIFDTKIESQPKFMIRDLSKFFIKRVFSNPAMLKNKKFALGSGVPIITPAGKEALHRHFLEIAMKLMFLIETAYHHRIIPNLTRVFTKCSHFKSLNEIFSELTRELLTGSSADFRKAFVRIGFMPTYEQPFYEKYSWQAKEFADFSNGLILAKLIETVCEMPHGSILSRFHDPADRLRKIHNMKIVLEEMRKSGISTEDVTPESLVAAKKEAILSILWSIVGVRVAKEQKIRYTRASDDVTTPKKSSRRRSDVHDDMSSEILKTLIVYGRDLNLEVLDLDSITDGVLLERIWSTHVVNGAPLDTYSGENLWEKIVDLAEIEMGIPRGLDQNVALFVKTFLERMMRVKTYNEKKQKIQKMWRMYLERQKKTPKLYDIVVQVLQDVRSTSPFPQSFNNQTFVKTPRTSTVPPSPAWNDATFTVRESMDNLSNVFKMPKTPLRGTFTRTTIARHLNEVIIEEAELVVEGAESNENDETVMPSTLKKRFRRTVFEDSEGVGSSDDVKENVESVGKDSEDVKQESEDLATLEDVNKKSDDVIHLEDVKNLQEVLEDVKQDSDDVASSQDIKKLEEASEDVAQDSEDVRQETYDIHKAQEAVATSDDVKILQEASDDVAKDLEDVERNSEDVTKSSEIEKDSEDVMDILEGVVMSDDVTQHSEDVTKLSEVEKTSEDVKMEFYIEKQNSEDVATPDDVAQHSEIATKFSVVEKRSEDVKIEFDVEKLDSEDVATSDDVTPHSEDFKMVSGAPEDVTAVDDGRNIQMIPENVRNTPDDVTQHSEDIKSEFTDKKQDSEAPEDVKNLQNFLEDVETLQNTLQQVQKTSESTPSRRIIEMAPESAIETPILRSTPPIPAPRRLLSPIPMDATQPRSSESVTSSSSPPEYEMTEEQKADQDVFRAFIDNQKQFVMKNKLELLIDDPKSVGSTPELRKILRETKELKRKQLEIAKKLGSIEKRALQTRESTAYLSESGRSDAGHDDAILHGSIDEKLETLEKSVDFLRQNSAEKAENEAKMVEIAAEIAQNEAKIVENNRILAEKKLKSAVIIQKIVRGFLARRRFHAEIQTWRCRMIVYQQVLAHENEQFERDETKESSAEIKLTNCTLHGLTNDNLHIVHIAATIIDRLTDLVPSLLSKFVVDLNGLQPVYDILEVADQGFAYTSILCPILRILEKSFHVISEDVTNGSIHPILPKLTPRLFLLMLKHSANRDFFIPIIRTLISIGRRFPEKKDSFLQKWQNPIKQTMRKVQDEEGKRYLITLQTICDHLL